MGDGADFEWFAGQPVVLFSGTLGAGKTYCAVEMLSRVVNRYILHNIEGLKGDLLDPSNRVRSFKEMGLEVHEILTEGYMERLVAEVHEKYGQYVLVVWDECHRWLARRDPQVEAFLSYTRHLQCEVWLICQNIRSQVHTAYHPLIQLHWRAVNPYINVFGRFGYKLMVDGEQCGTKWLRKKSEIFRLYKSQRGEAAKTKRSKAWAIVGAMGVLVPLAFLWAVNTIRDDAGKSGGVAQAAVSPKHNVKNMDRVGHGSTRIVPTPVSPFIQYGFAGYLGGRVILQSADGVTRYFDEVFPNARVITVNRSCVQVQGPEFSGIHSICKRNGFVQVPSVAPGGEPSAGSPAGGQVLTGSRVGNVGLQ